MENLQSFWYLCYQNTELCLLTCASLCLHVLQASNQMYYSYTMPCSLDALQTEWVCSCFCMSIQDKRAKEPFPKSYRSIAMPITVFMEKGSSVWC